METPHIPTLWAAKYFMGNLDAAREHALSVQHLSLCYRAVLVGKLNYTAQRQCVSRLQLLSKTQKAWNTSPRIFFLAHLLLILPCFLSCIPSRVLWGGRKGAECLQRTQQCRSLGRHWVPQTSVRPSAPLVAYIPLPSLFGLSDNWLLI